MVVKAIDAVELLTVPVGPEEIVTVGAVRSMVIALEARMALGPVLPAASATPLAARLSVSVPSVQLVIETVIEVPEAADGVPMTQPVAVPEVVKSDAARPDTVSEKFTVNVGAEALVGLAGEVTVAVGATESKMTLRSVPEAVVVALPAGSVTEKVPEGARLTVPWAEAVTGMVQLEPEQLMVPMVDRKSTRLNSSHIPLSRMPSSA